MCLTWSACGDDIIHKTCHEQVVIATVEFLSATTKSTFQRQIKGICHLDRPSECQQKLRGNIFPVFTFRLLAILREL